jgi:iron complex outermembrane receptor protein
MIHVDDKRTVLRACVTAISSLGALALPNSPVWAQAVTPNANELQEVVVTANRRTENQQSVPIAISVISGETAENLGITDMMTMANSIPGLNFQRQSNASIPFLRGVGTPVGQSGDEPSVSLYVDDVYIPAGSASLFNFNSIDRMEVEKGPQGTLFGRNATGGVVQVYTKNPSRTASLDANIGYANYDTFYYNAYATGPLTDTLSANIAGYSYDQSEGWGRNVFSGSPVYTAWNNGGRVKLLWEPSTKFSALLSYDIDKTRTQVGVAYRPAAGTTAVAGGPPPEGYYDVDEKDSFSVTKQQGASLKIDADFDWARLISITAWRQTDAQQDFAYDSIPFNLAYVNITNPEKTYTQEFRLLSPDSSKFRWIAGVFYFNDRAAYDPLKFLGAFIAPLPFIDTIGKQKTESYSGFADGTYPILEHTNITAGVRYTSDKREVTAGTETVPPIGFVPAPNSPQSQTWNKVTYRLALSQNFTPDIMGYVAYNRGFKSGIYNLVILPFNPIGAPVEPETLDAFTLGEKAEFMDHRLRVNAEAFYYKDKNIQVDEVNGAATFITNAASATFKGVDLDITFRPVAHLTITGSLEYLDGKYDSFPNGQFFVYQQTGGNCAFTVVPGGPVPCGGVVTPPGYNQTTGNWDLGGNKTIQSPPFSSYLSVAYQLPTPVGPFDFSVGWTHTGNYYADADNGKGQVAPSKPENDKQLLLDLVNASVSWVSANGHFNAQLYGRNLTGQKYWSFALEDAFETQYSAAAPRTYGLTLGVHW